MQTISLSNSNFEVIINPSLGGSVVAYNWLNHPNAPIQLLRDARNAKHVLEASNFPLVPFSNRIKNGTFVWQDKTYTTPLNFHPETSAIHGHAWQSEWDVKHQSDEQLILTYEGKAQDWPFAYIAQQTFTLSDDGLYHEISIKNLSDMTMPAGLGFHPYFVRTPNTTMKADVKQMWAVDDKCLPTQLTSVPAGLNEQMTRVNDVELDNGFTDFGGKAQVAWPELDAGVTIEASNTCELAVIFTPKDEDFFCIEPVSHCTDAINLANQGVQGTGIKPLAPNETFSIWMKLTPINPQ